MESPAVFYLGEKDYIEIDFTGRVSEDVEVTDYVVKAYLNDNEVTDSLITNKIPDGTKCLVGIEGYQVNQPNEHFAVSVQAITNMDNITPKEVIQVIVLSDKQ